MRYFNGDSIGYHAALELKRSKLSYRTHFYCVLLLSLLIAWGIESLYAPGMRFMLAGAASYFSKIGISVWLVCWGVFLAINVLMRMSGRGQFLPVSGLYVCLLLRFWA